jgi:hypothetical protein
MNSCKGYQDEASWERREEAKASQAMQWRKRGLKGRLKENIKRFKLEEKVGCASRGREVIRRKDMLGAFTRLKTKCSSRAAFFSFLIMHVKSIQRSINKIVSKYQVSHYVIASCTVQPVIIFHKLTGIHNAFVQPSTSLSHSRSSFTSPLQVPTSSSFPSLTWPSKGVLGKRTCESLFTADLLASYE